MASMRETGIGNTGRGELFSPRQPFVDGRTWKAAQAFTWAILILVLGMRLAPEARAGSDGTLRTLNSQSPNEQPLPADIRRGLNMDERVLSCFTDARGTIHFDERWFAATRFKLNDDDLSDWIVHNEQSCFGGVRWWVFRTFAHDHQLILATNAPELDIMREQVNGFRVIVANQTRYEYSGARSEYVAHAKTLVTEEQDGVYGKWEPESTALIGLGDLTLSEVSLQWSICRSAHVVPAGVDENGSAFSIEGSPGCRLDGRQVRKLRIKAREGCKAEISLYTDGTTMAHDAPLAWGIIVRKQCNRT